jgi:hypothetical protein
MKTFLLCHAMGLLNLSQSQTVFVQYSECKFLVKDQRHSNLITFAYFLGGTFFMDFFGQNLAPSKLIEK